MFYFYLMWAECCHLKWNPSFKFCSFTPNPHHQFMCAFEWKWGKRKSCQNCWNPEWKIRLLNLTMFFVNSTFYDFNGIRKGPMLHKNSQKKCWENRIFLWFYEVFHFIKGWKQRNQYVFHSWDVPVYVE